MDTETDVLFDKDVNAKIHCETRKTDKYAPTVCDN